MANQTSNTNLPGPKKVLLTSLDPIKLLQAMSPDDYEDVIEEWQRDYLEKKYVRVERLGGTGDKGRDIVCTKENGNWINYQCKRYLKRLTPSIALIEMGKLLYYCSKSDFQPPEKYYFISPKGVTVKLRDLLNDSDSLRNEIKTKWNTSCRTKILTNTPIELEGGLLDYIDNFDFSIFDYISEKEFLDDFKKTPHYTKHFGLLIKPRPIIEEKDIPKKIETSELTYIKKILDAYSDYLETNIEDATKLGGFPDILKNFNRQRLYFFSAEYLCAYSRETYAEELQCIEKLKDDIYHSIIDDIEDDAKNGFERLKKVLKRASDLTIQNNLLSSEITVKDKKGICHHLANERDDVKWKK